MSWDKAAVCVCAFMRYAVRCVMSLKQLSASIVLSTSSWKSMRSDFKDCPVISRSRSV